MNLQRQGLYAKYSGSMRQGQHTLLNGRPTLRMIPPAVSVPQPADTRLLCTSKVQKQYLGTLPSHAKHEFSAQGQALITATNGEIP